MLLKSGASLLLLVFFTKILSLVKLFTVAKWLGTELMGAFGIISLIIHAFDQIASSGFNQSLIQKKGNIDHLIPVVRTFRIVRGIAVSLIIYNFAQVFAEEFNINSGNSEIECGDEK